MKRKLFIPEQIISILQEAESGSTSISEVCRQHGTTDVTFYRWRRRYQGMTASDAKELKRLVEENARLKKLLAERDLEVDALKAVLVKKRLSPAERREVVEHLMAAGVSQRRSCTLAAISRSCWSYAPRPKDDEPVLAQLRDFADQYKRSGYWRAYCALHRQGLRISHKRVQRLWQLAKLQVPPRRRRRRRREASETVPLQAVYPRHVITYDFMEDSTVDGRKLRCLTIVDEFTRECLAIRAARSFRSTDVIGVWRRSLPNMDRQRSSAAIMAPPSRGGRLFSYVYRCTSGKYKSR